MTIFALAVSVAAYFLTTQSPLDSALTGTLVTIMLFVAPVLFLLNLALAIVFRKRRAIEVITYVLAGLIELAIFIFVLLLHIGVLTHVPLSLPAGLPINRAEIGGPLALAIGLFPAAYWHRTTLSQLRQRMRDDAKVIQNREGGVRIRGNSPGEWLN